MRELVTIVVVAGAAVAIAGPKPTKVPPIDVTPVADKLQVYKDEFGSYYVAPRHDAFGKDDDSKWVFYGDDKQLYQQRVISSSRSAQGTNWSVWAPRAKGMVNGAIELTDGDLNVKCRHKDGKRPLTQLTSDEAAAFFKRAKFYPQLWQRQAHFLARDDNAIYYYVDALREEHGGMGFRVFAGMKGAMKQVPITNMASDSAGEIYVTRTGQLKVVAPRGQSRDAEAFWIKGGKKTELTVLPALDNRYLIYRELGIYGQLGAICDDQ